MLAKLEQAGLSPAPPSDRVALIRRAYYDLIGLPPTPADIDAFISDTSDNAYEKVIDRLLASPQYGEKWGRHWLDLVRYAETNGYERDGTKPFAWRYRDYVVRSFNSDKPYDQFLREQLAGDEIEPADADAIIATGFYRLGLWDDEPADPVLARYDELDDIVTTVSQVFLGMTINCARCHDHKADPVPQADYYRLLAFFQDIPRYGERSISEKHVLTDISNLTRSADENRRRRLIADRQEQVLAEMTALEQAAIFTMSAEDQRATEGPQRAKVLKEKLHQHLSDEQSQLYGKLKNLFGELRKELEAARDLALSVNHCAVNPPDTHVLARGSPHAPGAAVEAGFPRVLGSAQPVVPGRTPNARTSGRRRILADWIASRDNPMTARVIANRLWQHHFGRGIVRTANDFGKLGERPSHPELLDWLAAELVDPSPRPTPLSRGGPKSEWATRETSTTVGAECGADALGRAWTLKRMHKLIMLSSTYQMSSCDNADGLRIDPANASFWRFDMRRLTAEELRDSILAVNGSLNLKMGGPSIYTDVPYAVLQTASRPSEAWGKSPPGEKSRRSIYIFVKRSLLEPTLGTFDMPDPDSSCAVRFATTVPTQALTSLNSEFFNEQARVFAERLRREAGPDASDQIRLGLQLILARHPRPDEIARCTALFNDLRQKDNLSAESAMSAVCLLMVNLNEFVYLD